MGTVSMQQSNALLLALLHTAGQFPHPHVVLSQRHQCYIEPFHTFLHYKPGVSQPPKR